MSNTDLSSNSLNGECPICLGSINNDDPYFSMQCCNKIAHIHCITEWYHAKSKKSLCFMCNQPTNIHNELVIDHNDTSSSSSQNDLNAEHTIEVTSEIRHSTDNLPILHLSPNRNKYRIIFISLSIITSMAILSALFYEIF